MSVAYHRMKATVKDIEATLSLPESSRREHNLMMLMQVLHSQASSSIHLFTNVIQHLESYHQLAYSTFYLYSDGGQHLIEGSVVLNNVMVAMLNDKHIIEHYNDAVTAKVINDSTACSDYVIELITDWFIQVFVSTKEIDFMRAFFTVHSFITSYLFKCCAYELKTVSDATTRHIIRFARTIPADMGEKGQFNAIDRCKVFNILMEVMKDEKLPHWLMMAQVDTVNNPSNYSLVDYTVFTVSVVDAGDRE
jgi:hypothetical protein